MTSCSISTRRSTASAASVSVARVGDAGGLVVDPVGADIVGAVARDQRVAHACLLALRLPASS